MNPRLVRAGVRVVCLRADVPGWPGKDQSGEDEAQAQRRHGTITIPEQPRGAQEMR
jgi:hypothetical protein